MDMVIFELAGQYFALPAAGIAEVLDPLPITPLPFAPEYVDGLVNLAGCVAVQMDAAMRLGLGERLAPDEGNVLVVVVVGARHALHVRRVLVKVSIPDEAINRYSASQEGQGAECDAGLAAVGEFVWSDQPVLLLDSAVFTLEGLAAVGVPEGGEGLLASVHAQAVDEAAAQAVADFPCVIVEAGRERYAFRLASVGEIVEAAELTTLPHAPREVAGMALLRGMPLLALSLSVMLGSESGGSQPQTMVVLENRGVRYGLLVDRVVGIQRFASGSLQAVDQGSDLEGYLIGAQGAMIGLLDMAGLLSTEREAAYRHYLVAQRGDDAAQQQVATRSSSIKRMLAFRLGGERSALPLEWVERVEEYQEETLLPNAEGSRLSGVVQIYGEVAPVVDLRREMGLPAGNNAQAAFLVVRKGGGIFALAVDRVEGVVGLYDKDIEPLKAAAADYIGAVGRLDGGLLSILRLDPLERMAANAA